MGKEAKFNERIAEIFFEMADIYELKEVKWKPQAYRIAGQTIGSLNQDIQDIYIKEGLNGIEKLSGIGEGIGKKIVEFIETEKIQEYEKLKESIPKGLLKILSIPGIGVKKASLFYNKLNIKTVKELEKAIKLGKLKNLPGFKEKSIENIILGIDLAKISRRRKLSEARKIAENIVNSLIKINGIEKAVVAGSIRREKPLIGDIDIVILTENSERVADKIVNLDFVKKVLGKGKEKITFIAKQDIQVDIRFFNKEEFGAGLLYFTGDKNHNIWLRKIAIKKGFKLNEYGLFENNKRIAGKTEEEIYKKLNVKILEPKYRI